MSTVSDERAGDAG